MPPEKVAEYRPGAWLEVSKKRKNSCPLLRQVMVFYVLTPCKVSSSWRFGGMCCFTCRLLEWLGEGISL